jgi:hypothetical protein
MAAGRGPIFRRRGGAGRRRAIFVAVAGIVVLAALAATVAFAQRGEAPASDAAPPADAAESRATEQASPAAEPAPEVEITAAVSPSSATVESPRTVASSWSAGPTPVAPAQPSAAAATEAERLAAEANATYGVRIVTEGQDWGAGEAAQAANIGAVISAMDRLPDTVISAVVAGPGGQLTFVSNNQGRTLGGWQPYGSHPMTYYTNSDHSPDGYTASNQVVVSVGAGTLSIGHEILHAFQSRDVGPDEYALALLQPEMRSFMAAVGWRQVGSDVQVQGAVNQPWSVVDELYAYEGRPLTYSNGNGTSTTMTAANPFEGFAIAGSFYYTRPSWMPQPDWPEYWAWFDANLG